MRVSWFSPKVWPIRFLAFAAMTCTCGVVWGGDDRGWWPQFRGPQASGVAEGQRTATTWDVEKGENVRWRTPLPGLGLSSPVIWGDRLFVTTAVAGTDEQPLKVGLYGDIQPVDENKPFQFRCYCLNAATGAIEWERTCHEGVPKVKRHPKSSHANASPATDGKHVVAFFGSEGLHCYDMTGTLLWRKDFGVLDAGYYVVPSAQWGFGSSPVLHDGKVLVLCDVQKDSFIAAFDVRDGKELWKTPRADVPTWGTPTVHAGADRVQVIVNGYKHAGGYDIQTGKELWKLTGGGDIPVPTPIIAHDLIFITNAHGFSAPFYAIRTTVTGDLNVIAGDDKGKEHLAWWHSRTGTYMQTPLVYGDLLYACRDNGVLTCYDAKTGEKKYSQRLGGGGSGFTASPVAADGKLYFTSEDGDVYVVKAGAAFEQAAQNRLGDLSMATPAIADGVLYFRTQKQVIAVAEK